jgi:peptidoglycan/LPS O-acetylase OafA/YrhL
MSVYASNHSIPVVEQFIMLFCLFATGIFMAEKKVVLAPWTSIILIVMGLLLLNHGTPNYFVNAVSLIAVGFFTLPYTLLKFVSWLRTFLDKSYFLGITWVGTISYSLYIWHYLLLNIFSGYELPELWRLYNKSNFLCSLLFTSIILIISSMSYWLIEKPSMLVLKQQLLKRIS